MFAQDFFQPLLGHPGFDVIPGHLIFGEVAAIDSKSPFVQVFHAIQCPKNA